LRTFSTNCARSSWPRSASALLLTLIPVVAFAAPLAEGGRGGDIDQTWYRLAQGLDKFNADAVREHADELLQVADRWEIQRLTPLSLALVAHARTLAPSQTEATLVQATRLDPGSPEAWFALADSRLARANLASGAVALGHAVYALFTDGRLHDLVAGSGLLAAVIAAVGGFALWALMAMRRAVPRLWHDLIEMGAQWRLGSNAVVLGVLIIALPIFAGGDPVWLLLWLFTLCWAYFPTGQRVIGVLGLLLVAASPTLVEIGFRAVTHPPNAIMGATDALAEHRYDPQVLQELGSLSDTFGDDPDYRRLVGDCDRQFGMLDAAAVSYREGLRVAPGNAPLSEALGTVHYLEGDYNAAVQSFQAALESGYDPVVAEFNLSFAFAQTYHFHESEDAMNAARHVNTHRVQALARERKHDIILPVVTRRAALAMLGRKDPLVLFNRGLLPPPLVRNRTFEHPLAIGAILALILALLHRLVRQRSGGFAAACLKCGRPFCRRCKLSHESQSYCTQCINIFLKKDMVGIDAQIAKRQQLARRQFWLRVERRVADVLLPGLGCGFAGRPLLGGALATAALACSITALVWVPGFISPALMDTPAWPLGLLAGVVWLAAAVTAQLLPVEWR
jgi:tetratricopeptide (TPR) repeat protein